MVLHGHKSNTAVAHPLPPAVRQCGHEPSLSRGICSLWSHIPCRLRRGKAATNRLSHGGFAPCGRTSPAACGGHCKRNCGERGIRTPGTHKEFNSFRDCPVRPLRHLSFNSGCKYTQKPRAMQMNLFNLHCRGATVYVAVRPNIRRSQKQMNFSNPIKTFIRDFAMWK